jgi:formate dehydrogenase subunit gamma
MTLSQAEALAPSLESIRALAAQHVATPGGLLPALHEIQHQHGYIPADAVPLIADAFNLSRAEVHGVITYYHHFRSKPPARCTVQVCRAESCKSMGADALLAHAEQRLGCTSHGHSADGAFALEPVYCLGLCASSPAILVGDKVHARMTPEKFDRVMAAARDAL